MTLDPVCHKLMALLIDSALKATLLLVLVALTARLLARRRPAWQGLLWASALIALLLLPVASTLLPALQVPILPAAPVAPEPPALSPLTSPAMPPVEPSSGYGTPSLPSPSLERPSTLETSAPTRRPSEPEIPAPARPHPTWPIALSAFYLAGLTLSLLRIGTGLWRVRRLRNSVRTFAGPADTARLSQWRARLSVRTPVDLGISDRVSVPTVIGIWRPLIVVPARLMEGSDAQTLDGILVHELAHVKRRDALYNLLGLLAAALYWYHPLVHFARRWLVEAREYACDDWAVATLDDADAYASTLLEVTARLDRHLAVAMGMDMARTARILDRIDRIATLNNRVRPHLSRLTAAFAVTALFATAVLLGCMQPTHARPAIKETPSTNETPAVTSKTPARPLRMTFRTREWGTVRHGFDADTVRVGHRTIGFAMRMGFVDVWKNAFPYFIQTHQLPIQPGRFFEWRLPRIKQGATPGSVPEEKAQVPALSYTGGVAVVSDTTVAAPGRSSLPSIPKIDSLLKTESPGLRKPNVFHHRQTQLFNLGYGDVAENSEQVRLNGRLLKRGQDYTLDYHTGALSFQPGIPAELADPSVKVDISWDSKSLKGTKKVESPALIASDTGAQGDSASVVGAQTHWKEELNRFEQARNLIFSTKVEERLNAIRMLEKLLEEFPQTFLEGDIACTLFEGYSRVTDDPRLLAQLAEKAIALKPSAGLYESIARVFMEKRILPEQTLRYINKALEIAGNEVSSAAIESDLYPNQQRIYTRRILLSRAYQRAGQPVQALKILQQSLQEVEKMPLTAFASPASPQQVDLASAKQSEADNINLALAELYVEQKQWELAYELTTQLTMNPSLVRDSYTWNKAVELWRTAYVGKFGSAEGLTTVYANMKTEQDKQRHERLIKERIKRPTPAFSLKTVKDEPVSLEALRGKVVVVYFWTSSPFYGWCSEQMEQLEGLKRTLRQEPVEFLLILDDERDETQRREIIWSKKSQFGRSLTYLMGNEAVMNQFGVTTFPYTCLIDPEGNIRYEQTGLSADFKASLKDQLTWLLGEAAVRK